MADIAGDFSPIAGSMRPVRPRKSAGRLSSRPTTPSAHPYVLDELSGKPRDVMTPLPITRHGVHRCWRRRSALMAPTADARRNRQRVGEMLLQRLLAQTKSARGARRCSRQGRGHDQHLVRQIAFYCSSAPSIPSGARRTWTAERIGESGSSVAGREPRAPAIDIRPGYENFWMVHPALHPFGVLRLPYAFGDCS